MSRPSWDEYFMRIAVESARRSTCSRRQVGCVLVGTAHNIISTGYNGSPSGSLHCIDAGCIQDGDGGCVRSVHAEANAVARAAMLGHAVEDAAVYVTTRPCQACALLLAAAGATRVLFLEEYRAPLLYPPSRITFTRYQLPPIDK